MYYCRSAPPSPTHHQPMMHSEFMFKDMESKFRMAAAAATGPPTTTHFTLPPFFSRLQAGSSSAHSLPASPSRSSGFTATPIKYFPVPMKAADDMAMLKKSHKYETIQEEQEMVPPPVKRVRIDERSLHDSKPEPPRVVPALHPLPPGQPNLQFLSLPMMGGPPRNQGMLAQPLSSFLPQNFFAQQQAAAANQNNRDGNHGNES